MLPAPARMAAAPRPRSGASWNPAVPPPPVAGGAVTSGLADSRGVTDGDADRPGVADGDADRPGDADRLGEGLTLELGVTLALPLGWLVGVAEPVPAGANGVGVGEGDDPVQAETDAEASMVKVAQPATVNLAPRPVPMMVVRIFMGAPHASGGWRTRFPVPAPEEKSRASQDVPGARRPRAGPGSAHDHKGKGRRRHKHTMACSSLEYQVTRLERPGEDGGRGSRSGPGSTRRSLPGGRGRHRATIEGHRYRARCRRTGRGTARAG